MKSPTSIILFIINNIHRNIFLFSFVLSIDFSVFYCIINRSTENLKGDPMFQQLSDTELMIMEYLWSQNTPKTFSEIKAFFEATTSKKGGFIRQPSRSKSHLLSGIIFGRILPTIYFSDNPNLFPWFFNFFYQRIYRE